MISTTPSVTGVWNGRVLPLVIVLTDAATVTPDANSADVGVLASLSQTTVIANPTGSPVNKQKLILSIKSAASQTISFGSQYRGSTDLPLPTTTTGGGLTDEHGFMWNATDGKWDYVAKTAGF